MSHTNETAATETPAEGKSKANAILRGELARTISLLDEAKDSTALNDWEKGFVADLVGRLRTYGLKTKLSCAQVMVMNRTAAKLALAA